MDRRPTIAMIDSSLFTLPYDDHLAVALAEAGGQPILYGRRPRAREGTPRSTYQFKPFFYRGSELLFDRSLPARAAIKAAEHLVDMVRLWRELVTVRPDVIHFQWVTLPLIDTYVIDRLAKLAPLVLTVHDLNPFNGAATHRLMLKGYDAALAKFDRLIVHTQAGRVELIGRGLQPQRIAVVPHGLLTGDGGATWTIPPVSPGRQRILLFGKIKYYKGLDILIEAVAALPTALRDRIELAVIGQPAMDMAPITEAIRRHGLEDTMRWDLRFIDEAEMRAWFASAAILAFPYREIEASGVLMAALPAGKPIVASDIGVFRQLLRDGEHGRLVAPDDAPALSAALAELIENEPRARMMGERVAELAKTVAPWSMIAATTLGVYGAAARDRLIAASRKAPSLLQSSFDPD